MMLQKKCGTLFQLGLLAALDTVDGASEAVVCPVSHLDKYQYVALAHDQIDLAAAGRIIPRHQREALAGEKLFRTLLP